MTDIRGLTGTIYQGFWTDWSKGKLLGTTLTLDPAGTIFLTNSLAMVVTLCGIQLWTILRFALHQWAPTSSHTPSTPHLNKQQLILRNAGSALSTAQLMLELACTSRRSTGQRSRRAYFISLLATIYAIMFMVAAIFSNRVISLAQDDGVSAVLVKSRQCGVWNETYRGIVQDQNYSDEAGFALYAQYVSDRSYDVQLSLDYAQKCYSASADSSMSSPTCRTLKQPTIGSSKSYSIRCPFQASICHSTSQGVTFDTGDIDSHKDLGINALPDERLRYRKRTTCAVLNGTSYVTDQKDTTSNSSTVAPADTIYAYYGPSSKKKTSWTYAYTNFASSYNNFTAFVTQPYQLYVESTYAPAEPQWSTNDFVPVPELSQNNSDVTLLFLSFTGTYVQEIDDPWFSAHNLHSFNTTRPYLQSRYAPDATISTVGCTEEHQFCTSNDTCTGFLGWDQMQNVEAFNTVLTPRQNATFDRMLLAASASNLRSAVIPPLLASASTYPGKSGAVLSSALPENQWVKELEFWHSVGMAQLQRNIVEWANARVAPYSQSLIPATAPQDVWFCNNVVVPSAVCHSFSVIAIVLIIAFGLLVTTVSFFIEQLANTLRKCFRKNASTYHWGNDDLLKLKRTTIVPLPLPKDERYLAGTKKEQQKRNSCLET